MQSHCDPYTPFAGSDDHDSPSDDEERRIRHMYHHVSAYRRYLNVYHWHRIRYHHRSEDAEVQPDAPIDLSIDNPLDLSIRNVYASHRSIPERSPVYTRTVCPVHGGLTEHSFYGSQLNVATEERHSVEVEHAPYLSPSATLAPDSSLQNESEIVDLTTESLFSETQPNEATEDRHSVEVEQEQEQAQEPSHTLPPASSLQNEPEIVFLTETDPWLSEPQCNVAAEERHSMEVEQDRLPSATLGPASSLQNEPETLSAESSLSEPQRNVAAEEKHSMEVEQDPSSSATLPPASSLQNEPETVLQNFSLSEPLLNAATEKRNLMEVEQDPSSSATLPPASSLQNEAETVFLSAEFSLSEPKRNGATEEKHSLEVERDMLSFATSPPATSHQSSSSASPESSTLQLGRQSVVNAPESDNGWANTITEEESQWLKEMLQRRRRWAQTVLPPPPPPSQRASSPMSSDDPGSSTQRHCRIPCSSASETVAQPIWFVNDGSSKVIDPCPQTACATESKWVVRRSAEIQTDASYVRATRRYQPYYHAFKTPPPPRADLTRPPPTLSQPPPDLIDNGRLPEDQPPVQLYFAPPPAPPTQPQLPPPPTWTQPPPPLPQTSTSTQLGATAVTYAPPRAFATFADATTPGSSEDATPPPPTTTVVAEAPQMTSHPPNAQPVCFDYLRKRCWRRKCYYHHPPPPPKNGKIPGVLKFCHNFQNTQCTRENCNYFHGTSAEEIEYIATGKLPYRAIDFFKGLQSNAE